MFCIKNPSELNKPWILSKPNEDEVSIPIEVTKFLKNYHIMAIEFLYHNYRKGVDFNFYNFLKVRHCWYSHIVYVNEEQDMNLPLQLSAFFRALVGGPAIILVICRQENVCNWHYHLRNNANLEVVQVSSKNSTISYKDNTKKLALIVNFDCLKLCEDLIDHNFFSVVIEDFDQIALKRIIKRLSGSFNIGLTYRSFYVNPDQKLLWTMMDWANPGCVGKLNDFYEKDTKNVQNFNDNYRFWWLRLTWQFCDSFKKPTAEENDNYNTKIADWAAQNSLSCFTNEDRKLRKRKIKTSDKNKETPKSDETMSDKSLEGKLKDVPSEKYVKLPSMDEIPIVSSIIKNFEISPEPILTHKSHISCTQSKKQSFTFTDTQPNCSRYSEESVCLSFLEDEQKPSTSKSESEEFILNLI